MKTIQAFSNLAKFNYFYNGQTITKLRFEENVPENWMEDFDEENVFTYGYYKAQLIEEIKVDKSDFEIVEFQSGYFGICGESNGSQCVYGGDSACEDHYNESYIQAMYDEWDGTLVWQGETYGYQAEF